MIDGSLGARVFAAFAAVFVFVSAASAAPTISNLSLRGLQVGGTTTLVIDGADLMPGGRILLPVPIAAQEVQPGSNPQRLTVAVTLDATVPPGIYPARVASQGGISEAVPLGIDPLPQAPFAEECPTLPVALHGALTGGTELQTRFAAQTGQRIVVDVESQRLGGKLNPILHLYDPRGVQLAWSQSKDPLDGDARLTAEIPVDGIYTVELHDALHQGTAPSHFRLKIGSLQHADLVYPLAVQRGKTADLELLGGSIPPDVRVSLTADTIGASLPAPWPPLAAISGSRPFVLVSDFPEFVESDSAESPQGAGTPPLGINGRLATAGEEDAYRLTVTPGAKLRFDVLAHRAGSPLDGVLTLRKEQGGDLATNDDRDAMVDPGLDFTVPGGVETLLVAVKDLLGRGGREFVYRIEVTPFDMPSLEITASADRVIIPSSGTALLPLDIKRAAFTGPIKLTFDGLPEGIQLSSSEIPPQAAKALISFTDVSGKPAQEIAVLAAQSGDPQQTVAARVVLASPGLRPTWLANRLALAITEPAAMGVTLTGFASDQTLPTGTRIAARIELSRGDKALGAVRLSLLTSQAVPQKQIKRDNKDVMVDDTDRAIRLEGEPMVAADARELEIAVLVPADLPPMAYDLAIQADLLSPDGKQVLASAVSPVHRLSAVAPPASKAER